MSLPCYFGYEINENDMICFGCLDDNEKNEIIEKAIEDYPFLNTALDLYKNNLSGYIKQQYSDYINKQTVEKKAFILYSLGERGGVP